MKKSERNAAAAAEATRLAGLLKQKADAYVQGIERNNQTVNFDRIPADQLLVIEAFNDWSAGALGEGDDVRFTFMGADPACSTEQELQSLLGRLRENQALLYPVTSFLLSDDEQCLQYRPLEATYRLRPHIDGSRASAVRVAEVKHISDPNAAHQLWVSCATDDCFAYLVQQMSPYSLWLEEEEVASTKRLVASYVQDRFSPAQIWNAMWRAAREAAALSKRRYFNSAKAAKTIPKILDKKLNAALEDPSFRVYDRMLSTPVGAVLMLFRQRFGVGDTTPGWQVREILEADAALAPPVEEAQSNGPAENSTGQAIPQSHRVSPNPTSRRPGRASAWFFAFLRLTPSNVSPTKNGEQDGEQMRSGPLFVQSVPHYTAAARINACAARSAVPGLMSKCFTKKRNKPLHLRYRDVKQTYQFFRRAP